MDVRIESFLSSCVNMAMFEFCQNMYDVKLKPRLLRSLTREHLPDENHPFPGPLELSNLVSMITTHGLLSESVGEPVDRILLDKWKSAVDVWVERLSLIISSKMLDKCWAGICLLGVASQQCNPTRFLNSYSAWFQQFLLQTQASCVNMAMFEFYQNMYDVKLKPRLLRSFTREHLPDENHPFPRPLELSNLVSMITTHGLLSESVGEPVDRILLDKWKSAVDAWVERLSLLISSKMLDKCWAGICLLGVTSQQCSTTRFLDSYSAWFQQFLLQIQNPPESQLVKVASCASLSDMFTRLSGIPSVKKDATSLAGKLCQPILKLLAEDVSESVWEGAIDLFCTLISFFPSSVHRHYNNAEDVILSKIMSGKCNANMSKKFAYCLALLPRTRGDQDSWSLMLQRILIYINTQLNDALQGLEDETKGSEAMKLLIQPGKDPPPPLGGPRSGKVSDNGAQISEKILFYRVSTLMQCSSMMLINPYPVQVTVPVRALLALVRRVLLVDGSSSKALLQFLTVTQQESICSELPILHLHSLELLTSIIKGIRSQLLPNAAEVVRLVTEYFGRCMLPELRIKLYTIVKILLISMGVGMSLYLAQEVINNVFVDLDAFTSGSADASGNMHAKSLTYALQQPSNKKRKHATATGFASDNQTGISLELELAKGKPTTLVSVQIAALQALEALLTVGGALKAESWRPNVDRLLITVATNACEEGWANEERTVCASGELSSTWADFQLAALHALLASLLSPARCRPPYLSRGLELFRRGKQETGTKLAEFCAHALLALEVLIHPRALPLADFPLRNSNTVDEGLNRNFPGNPFSGFQKQNTPFPSSSLGLDENDLDDLCKTWLGNDEEVEAPVNNVDKNMEDAHRHSETHGEHIIDTTTELLAADNVVSTMDVDKGRISQPAETINVEKRRSMDEAMLTVERSQFSSAINDVGTFGRSVAVSASHSGSMAIESTEIVTDNTAESSKGIISATDDALTTGKPFSLGKMPMFDHDSDTDSIPDIVDADPDSEDI